MLEFISRQQAISAGIRRYFTGTPCAQGHISEFYVDAGCIACRNLRNKIRKAANRPPGWAPRPANLDNLTTSERKKIKNAQWRIANRDKSIVASALWRESNQARAREMVLAWHASNKDRRREHKQNRRARKKENGGQLSAGIVAKLLRLQRGRCTCCGAPLGNDYHLDHIIPLAKGGANTDENVQLLTQRCNNQKKDKDPILFMQQRGFLI